MRLTMMSGLGAEVKRLWVVQRYRNRGGWFDWSVCTTLKEAEEDYLTAIQQDGTDKDVRLISVKRSAVINAGASA